MEERTYFVYILTNRTNNVLYTGVTGDLIRRAYQHRHHQVEGFTDLYNVTKLVYFEAYPEIWDAIAREKQIKSGPRRKKIQLVNSINPEWHDFWPVLTEDGPMPASMESPEAAR